MQITAVPGLPADEACALYNAVGWQGYTKDPELLVRALTGSHLLLTARDERGRLAGLARTISDGVTVCYVQDLLVHPDFQRRGVGRLLMEELKKRYEHCRFFILSTDAPGTSGALTSHPFYRSLGLIPHHEQDMTAFGLPITW
ncbi:GNAT family N-acetyltransferase [Actinoplanes sp. TFC3]|uniref:GNAT family N-acetyltransferase n=1 Tax=Actinoplanes sp. TFC3 TaxID=1710355 RepID=UPI00082F1DCB|nr:GNAT family N-acetyltransferase [Actinoplanes sp. TFC3]